MGHVLGIDAGGTKTVCLLADDQGNIVAEARRGGANLQAAGELEVEKVLHQVMEEAIGDRAIVPATICLGIAGVDRPDDYAVVGAIMRRIGYKARVIIVNDALVALESGAPGQPGVVVISGTGSISYGRNAKGEAARSGGWGYVLGDEGSGYWIGRAALRAVLRQADRRGPVTVLSELLLTHFDVDAPQELIHKVYTTNLKPTAIGALAKCVQSAFSHGDAVAIGILRRRLTSSNPSPCRSRVVSNSSDSRSCSSWLAASFAPSPGSKRNLNVGFRLLHRAAGCGASIASRRLARLRSRCKKRVAAR